MQNKPNLLNAQMNVSSALTKDYENERLCRRWKNKAKTKPISNFLLGMSYGENYVLFLLKQYLRQYLI